MEVFLSIFLVLFCDFCVCCVLPPVDIGTPVIIGSCFLGQKTALLRLNLLCFFAHLRKGTKAYFQGVGVQVFLTAGGTPARSVYARTIG